MTTPSTPGARLQPRAHCRQRQHRRTTRHVMLNAPVPATKKGAWPGRHRSLADIDLFEVNEAFRRVPVERDSGTSNIDREKINGQRRRHRAGLTIPSCATRLLLVGDPALSMSWSARKAGVALITMCAGGGMRRP